MHARYVKSRLAKKFVQMIKKEHRDYNELAEMALLEKLKKLKMDVTRFIFPKFLIK